MQKGWAAFFLVVWGLIAWPTLALAGGAFTVGGHPVEPQETNFAGARHASPKYRIVVQINHDTQATHPLELNVVDDVYRALVAQHTRQPYLPADSLPVVVVAEVKLRQFLTGPKRLLFGNLETEIKKQQDVYLSPTAIFVTDAAFADSEKLRAALRLGLSYLFNADFYRAVVGLDHAIPRPVD